MEARSPQKKLTRRERLNICGVNDEDIPQEFIDTGLTYDIMEEAGLVDGKMLDLVAVKKWQQEKIAEMLKKHPPATPEEIQKISQVNPFTRNPFKSYHPLPSLNEKIEHWVYAKEITYVGQAKENQKREALKLVEFNLQKAKERFERVYANENPLLSAVAGLFSSNHDKAYLLAQIDELNKAKTKLMIGNRYYNNPDVLHYEINRLLEKQESGHFTQDDQNELELCYKKLDDAHREPRLFLRKFRPTLPAGLLQIINPPNEHERIAVRRLNNGGSEDL